jgi:hypothetical protein
LKYRIILQNTKSAAETENNNNNNKNNRQNSNNNNNIKSLPVKISTDSGLSTSLSSFGINEKPHKFDNKIKKEDFEDKSLLLNDPSLSLSDIADNSTKNDVTFQDDNFNDEYKFDSNIGTFNEEDATAAAGNSLVLKRNQIEGYETLVIICFLFFYQIRLFFLRQSGPS